MEKTCKKCGAAKPCDEEHFRKTFNRHGKQYFVGACLDCERAAARARRAKALAERPLEIAMNRRAYRASSELFKMKKRDESNSRNLRKAIRDAGGEPAYRAALIGRLVRVLQKMAHRLDWPAGEPFHKVCWLWNKPGISAGESYKIRYALDENFHVAERIRHQINKRRKRDRVGDLMRGAIRRNGESGMVQQLLGYSISDLRRHLERQFVGGMSWERFMAGEIHIDHITPQSRFDLSNDDQWRKCWCLSNLRPMWARENIQKSDKILYLI